MAFHAAPLCSELQPMLDAELAAGNTVKETGPAPGSEGTLYLLSRGFRAGPAVLPVEVYRVDINDPHWWKAEYRCKLHPHVIACPFD